MLNKNNINRVRRILSAQNGTQVPKFLNPTSPLTPRSRISCKKENGRFYINDTEVTEEEYNRATSGMSDTFGNFGKDFENTITGGTPTSEDIQTYGSQGASKMAGYPHFGTSNVEITKSNKDETGLETPLELATESLKKVQLSAEDIHANTANEQEKLNSQIKSNISETVNAPPSPSPAGVVLSAKVAPIQEGPDPENLDILPPEAVESPNDNVAQSRDAEDTESVDAETAEEPKINMSEGTVRNIAGAADGIRKSLFANLAQSDSELTGGINGTYDAISDSLMGYSPVGTVVGGAMKVGAFLGDAVQALGAGTDQMTAVDQVMDSSLFSWNIGAINGALGSKADTFTANKETLEKVGGSYGGTTSDIMDAQSKSGKKYGLFSSSSRKKANRVMAEARRKQNTMTDIAQEAENRRITADSMKEARGLSYRTKILGGYDLKYMRAAKEGGILDINDDFEITSIEEDGLGIYSAKSGGILNFEEDFDIEISSPYDIETYKIGGILESEDWEPIIIDCISEEISTLKSGGKLRKNEDGEIIPEKCDECGGEIIVQIHGEPVYLCKECNKYFGVVPFKKKNGGELGDTNIEVIETNTTQKSVIPEGALHKNKHHLDLAGVDDSELTKKGIPVVDNNGEQLAEIELNEIIFTLEVTKELEKRYKEFYEESTSNDRKNELALEAGKLLWKEIIYNTDDRTGLIDTLKKGGVLLAPKFLEGGSLNDSKKAHTDNLEELVTKLVEKALEKLLPKYLESPKKEITKHALGGSTPKTLMSIDDIKYIKYTPAINLLSTKTSENTESYFNEILPTPTTSHTKTTELEELEEQSLNTSESALQPTLTDGKELEFSQLSIPMKKIEGISGLSFMEMILKYGEGVIKVENTHLRPLNANYGVKNSWHKQAHPIWKNSDGTPMPMAFDLTPTFGHTFADMWRVLGKPEWQQWLASQPNGRGGQGWGIWDESTDAIRRTKSWKSTGNHIHLGAGSSGWDLYVTAMKKYNNLTISATPLQLLASLQNAASSIPTTSNDNIIKINKTNRTLTVNGQTFKISLSKNGLDNKQKAEDGLTPEGEFTIIGKQEMSSYQDPLYGLRPNAYGGMFYRLSYKDNKGESHIGIHGSDLYNSPENYGKTGYGTHGCIALSAPDLLKFSEIINSGGGIDHFKVQITKALSGGTLDSIAFARKYYNSHK